MSKQAMGDLVDQCEAWGLVRREPDPLDARARRIVFTPTGLAVAGGLPAAVAQAEAEFREWSAPTWPPWWRWAWRPTRWPDTPECAQQGAGRLK
jgi:hypothetical protein